MPVFRYDTRDVVRPLDHGELTCEVAGLPGCSPVLGKADQLIHLGPGSTHEGPVVPSGVDGRRRHGDVPARLRREGCCYQAGPLHVGIL